MRVTNLLCLALFGALVASCDTRTVVDRANEANILVVGNSNEPKGLDPHLVSGVLESNILRALFEGLAVDNPSEDGVATKGQGGAVDWSANEDFTVWTFLLNPEGKWSDGVPVTAHDYVFAYHRMLDPELPAKYADMLYFLKNAETINRDTRSFALMHEEPDLGIEPAKLKEPPFQGDSGVDAPISNPLDSYPEAYQKLFLKARGLDRLNSEQLRFVVANPGLVAWPAEVPAPLREKTLAKLLDYVGKHESGEFESLGDVIDLGVRAVDDFTLELSLRGPIPFLPEITKHYTWYPVPRHAILRAGEIDEPFPDDTKKRWTSPENMVCNGPFKLKSWRITHSIEVERNPYYWDAKNVKLNGVKYMPISNAYTETRMFLDGLLHLTYTVPPEMIPYAQEHRPEMLRQEPYVGVRFLRCNTEHKPLDDPRVRHALAAALDREDLIDNIMQGGQQPAFGITPPFGAYETPNVISYDPEKARKLLAEAGYPNGDGFPELKFLTNDREISRRMGEAYQSMWKKILGVNVRIDVREWTTYLQRQYDGEYDIAAGGWIGDYLDPTTFLEMWTEGNGNNNTGWASKDYAAALHKSENTADPAERFKVLAEAENILLKDLPVIPIYWYTTNYLIRPEVKNWHPLLLNNHPFKYVSLEPVKAK